MRTIVIAALALTALSTWAAPAAARHRATQPGSYAAQPCPDNSGRWCAAPSRTSDSYSARRRAGVRRGSGGCRTYLGCGCHLAAYLGVPNPHHVLDRARNWLTAVGRRASHGCVGCVVVLRRGRGGHVAVVRDYDAHGNPVGYSWGNRRVGWFTKTYSRHRVIGYVRVSGL